MPLSLTRTCLVALAVASCFAHPAATPSSVAPESQAANTRSITVSVLGRNDMPVPDLTIKDFTVREDGRAREVVRVEQAAPPTHIALLVDNSQVTQPLVRDLRQGLTTFADQLADATPAPAIRVTTFGARPEVKVDFTPAFSGVSRAIETITPATGAGAVLLEAILETCKDLRTRKIDDAVFVVFLAETGVEFSTATERQVREALQAVRASLWVMTLQDRTGSAGGSSERREREAVVGDVTTASGGRNVVVLAAQQIPQAFSNLSHVLLSRYAVTYGRPDALIPPKRVEVTGRDRAWKLQVSEWPAR